MAGSRFQNVEFQALELGGVRYAVVRESTLLSVCEKAGFKVAVSSISGESESVAEGAMDADAMAERIVQRRHGVGVTQAELARRAGIRVETLNRIERGKTTPDFSTIRKIVTAINEVEGESGDITPIPKRKRRKSK